MDELSSFVTENGPLDVDVPVACPRTAMVMHFPRGRKKGRTCRPGYGCPLVRRRYFFFEDEEELEVLDDDDVV